MIEISKINKDLPPYVLFKSYYDLAIENSQKSIEAVAISSIDQNKMEVDSRYVNLKFIIDNEWIFFSNYNSKKALEFSQNNKISALFFWNEINVQIRIKAIIDKTSQKFNKEYFSSRSKSKNALAISSMQSKKIDSYESVKKNYHIVSDTKNLINCPDYWGGYFFIPYYFEFWEGHESRLNKREVFENIDGYWKHSFLQP